MQLIVGRLADSLRSQNWFTVLLEIVILVVGIFIGLQVDDWNQARKDRIEERDFIARLHSDMEASMDFLDEIRKRHQNTWENTEVALDVLFSRIDRDELSTAECDAIARSIFFLPVTIQLPSLEELIATGRLTIVRDAKLRTGLARLEQLSNATRSIVDHSDSVVLSQRYPDLLQLEAYWNKDENEIRVRFQCDLAAMRSDHGFLSDYSLNADSFDAFYSKGTIPELEQLATIHKMVDRYLGIEHQERR